MRRSTLAAVLAVTLLLGIGAVLAQGGYDLGWSTVDGGGGTSSSGAYSVSGTFGQPDAGTLTGGSYTLAGGFWAASSGFSVYVPVMRR
jgi:hypothetical protein